LCREKTVLDARVVGSPDLLFRACAGLERDVCVETRMKTEQLRSPFGKGFGLCKCDAWLTKGYHRTLETPNYYTTLLLCHTKRL
jgi:hypothetical protein